MKLSHALLCLGLCVLSVSGAKTDAQEDAYDSLLERDSSAGPRGLHYWRLPRGSDSLHRLHGRDLTQLPDDDELTSRAEQELKFLDKKPWGRRSLNLALRQSEGGAEGLEPTGLASSSSPAPSSSASGGAGRLHRRIRPDWLGDTAENRRPGWRAGYTPPGNADK
ncbi:hypothetical protein BCV69DRAFT_295801 [Microstroma glucosiphilum]|uniref:Uncharacterized protein n=1 Tax=Pseudomicrostroma glucosiphilum TaxID=1684307 RepID=A0A316UEX7_9BASI|nr:hypothetical protein BCV69DRAFT_295801 [Pseudomicrostroma glucosiphilum]PWN23464.1 hypothetical protein BCV69DRAFT_295801 [Pseudomicrostroma glucosiphilum]